MRPFRWTERATTVIFGNLNGGPKPVSVIGDNGGGGAVTALTP